MYTYVISNARNNFICIKCQAQYTRSFNNISQKLHKLSTVTKITHCALPNIMVSSHFITFFVPVQISYYQMFVSTKFAMTGKNVTCNIEDLTKTKEKEYFFLIRNKYNIIVFMVMFLFDTKAFNLNASLHHLFSCVSSRR